MKRFQIFEHPKPAQGYRQHDAVKDGWCWPAFCGTSGWAFGARLHRLGVLVIVGWVVAIVVLYMFSTRALPDASIWLFILLVLLANLCARLLLGAIGNRLRREYLRARGYVLVDTVPAQSRSAAIAQYDADG